MVSEEVRMKKLCVKASRATLEDTVRFFSLLEPRLF